MAGGVATVAAHSTHTGSASMVQPGGQLGMEVEGLACAPPQPHRGRDLASPQPNPCRQPQPPSPCSSLPRIQSARQQWQTRSQRARASRALQQRLPLRHAGRASTASACPAARGPAGAHHCCPRTSSRQTPFQTWLAAPAACSAAKGRAERGPGGVGGWRRAMPWGAEPHLSWQMAVPAATASSPNSAAAAALTSGDTACLSRCCPGRPAAAPTAASAAASCGDAASWPSASLGSGSAGLSMAVAWPADSPWLASRVCRGNRAGATGLAGGAASVAAERRRWRPLGRRSPLGPVHPHVRRLRRLATGNQGPQSGRAGGRQLPRLGAPPPRKYLPCELGLQARKRAYRLCRARANPPQAPQVLPLSPPGPCSCSGRSWRGVSECGETVRGQRRRRSSRASGGRAAGHDGTACCNSLAAWCHVEPMGFAVLARAARGTDCGTPRQRQRRVSSRRSRTSRPSATAGNAAGSAKL